MEGIALGSLLGKEGQLGLQQSNYLGVIDQGGVKVHGALEHVVAEQILCSVITQSRMIGKGCHRIAFFGGKIHPHEHFAFLTAQTGFRGLVGNILVHKECGLCHGDAVILVNVKQGDSGFNHQHLLQGDGLVAMVDEVAHMLIEIIVQTGKILGLHKFHEAVMDGIVQKIQNGAAVALKFLFGHI